jgi:hypothetical protein
MVWWMRFSNSSNLRGRLSHGGGETEAVVDEVLLAALVAEPHAVDLGDGGVAFVDEEQEVAGEVVEQGGRGSPGRRPEKWRE